MEYTCHHCGANLDEGDIFEYFFNEYNDYSKALNSAKLYGWCENNKKHFKRSIIIQPDDSEQYTICPDCKNCLSGYSDKVKIQISENEEISNIISVIMENRGIKTTETLKEEVSLALKERGYEETKINEWLKYIK